MMLLNRHSINNHNLICGIPSQLRRETTLNLSNLHDKINSGELVESPRELLIKTKPSEVIQELQTLCHKASGKIHFSRSVTRNLLFKDELFDYH